MANQDHTTSMKNAEASVRLEGYEVTPQMREHCEQVLSGKATAAEVLKQFTASKTVRVTEP